MKPQILQYISIEIIEFSSGDVLFYVSTLNLHNCTQLSIIYIDHMFEKINWKDLFQSGIIYDIYIYVIYDNGSFTMFHIS